jgi:hypothetical protein
MYEPSAMVFHKVSSKRMKLKYIWKRAFYQGYSKALINKTMALDLDVERNYLNYLITSSVKSRLGRFYHLKNLIQLFTLCLSSCLVLFGFIVGKVCKVVG